MGKTIWVSRFILRLCVSGRSISISREFSMGYLALRIPAFALPPTPVRPPIHRATITSPKHPQLPADCESSKLVASHLAFLSFFFFLFYSRRFVWKRNDNKSSRFERFSQEKKRTDVHRHGAENVASNSWGSDRPWGGWPPHRVQTWTQRQSNFTWFASDFGGYLPSPFQTPRRRRILPGIKWHASSRYAFHNTSAGPYTLHLLTPL